MTQPERVSDEELDDIVADECSPNQRQVDLLAMECQWSRCELSHLRERNAVLERLATAAKAYWRTSRFFVGEKGMKREEIYAISDEFTDALAALDHPAPQKTENDAAMSNNTTT